MAREIQRFPKGIGFGYDSAAGRLVPQCCFDGCFGGFLGGFGGLAARMNGRFLERLSNWGCAVRLSFEGEEGGPSLARKSITQ